MWFGNEATEFAEEAAQRVDQALMAEAANSDRHLQLVLPLRAPAELTIAANLGQTRVTGVDIAIVHSSAAPAGMLGVNLRDSSSEIGRLTSVADRSFSLMLSRPPGVGEPASDVVALGLLCTVCDEVLLACQSDQYDEAMLHQVDPMIRNKIRRV